MSQAMRRQPVDTALMRGGTSRGPVLLADSLPREAAARDAAVLRLVGGGAVQTDALGGGTPVTSKVVLVQPVPDDASGFVLEYTVGNVVIGRDAVDWKGTCGNMTATVPVYALEEGIVPPTWDGPIRLRNTSTGGIVETAVTGMATHERGQEAVVSTRYLRPEGAVLGRLLPTGEGVDRVTVGSRTYQASLVDVTHPYLFLLHDEVVGAGELREPGLLELIERIRGEFSTRLGLAASPARAATEAPAVPRVVLLHGTEADALRISAISMGQAIASIPVTAAMCLAAASQLPSTLVARLCGGAARAGELTLVSSGARMSASARADPAGGIASVTVDRTARTLMRGTAWI